MSLYVCKSYGIKELCVYGACVRVLVYVCVCMCVRVCVRVYV